MIRHARPSSSTRHDHTHTTPTGSEAHRLTLSPSHPHNIHRPPRPRPLQGERWAHPRPLWMASRPEPCALGATSCPAGQPRPVWRCRQHIPLSFGYVRGSLGSSARRRKHLNGSLAGFFLIGYSSICQLFKFSYRLLHAKVFTGENFIKTLFSINYRGYFIIQATHFTINYSYFYIKQTENTWKTNKIVKNHHKTNKKLLIIWFIRYKYLSLHH